MKKSKKIMLRLVPVLLLVVVVLAGNVFATGSGVSTDWPTAAGQGVGTIDTAAQKVWKTLLTIFQILAIAAIVIAGIRYMFASADQKADIKKSLVILVLGAVLVFAASTIAQVIVNATSDVTGIS